MQKQPIDISFAQGLDLKTDPKRVQAGKFLSLKNSVFQKGGELTKRNGYGVLTELSNDSFSYLTTLGDNLTAIGSSISAYNSSNATWVSKGSITPLNVSTKPLIRNNLNQTQCDACVSANGLVCTVYSELNNSTTTIKYAIADSSTGQNIIAPVAIPVSSGAVTGSARVFLLGSYFIIVFTNVISAASHLQFIAISTANPSIVTANKDISSPSTNVYVSATTVSWDGVVVSNKLFIGYNTTTGGQAIKLVSLSSTLSPSAVVTFSGRKATMMSMCADISDPANARIYCNFYDLSTTSAYTIVVDYNLGTILAPALLISSGTALNIASAAQNGTGTIYFEVSNNYSYNSGVPTHYIVKKTVTPLGIPFTSVFSSGTFTITASSARGLVNGMTIVDNTTPANIGAGNIFTISGTTLTLTTATAGNSASAPGDTMSAVMISPATLSLTNAGMPVVIRSLGLASKAFIINGVEYFLGVYQSPFQNTYFLINGSSSTAASPLIVSKLAYENGGGYLTLGLPAVSINGTIAQIPYLYKDFIASLSTNGNTQQTTSGGIYSQTGINLSNFNFTSDGIDTVESAGSLMLSGGFLGMYDGYLPVEHNFFVWPDSILVASDVTSGSMSAQQYYYQVTYEWSDNNGNIYRSAPSIPQTVTLTSDTSVRIDYPMLRLTMKTANPVKIVIYRWSAANQTYYQVTSLIAPQLNDTTLDSGHFIDTFADASIVGNSIIYTTGGVIEDINAPATNIITLFDTRMWMVNAEDPNVVWYSKQVIENTPVEMSDLLTLYVAPNAGTSVSTGPIKAMAPMDDKLILFKKDAIYYINGIGPDNTGNNNQYSQPIFITSTVGCSNQQSIVLTSTGLMFQSDKGIWLLDRNLGTSYIGAPVNGFNGSIVNSSVNVPETNQIRYTLNTGETLMYDYYYQQWGTFYGVPAISSCVYNSLHTFINSYGEVYQETPDLYLDGANPVVMSFTTSWFNFAGLQGFERAYYFYLLGTYYSPHKLQLQISYDYVASPSQSKVFTPDNYSSATPSPYGDQPAPFGAPTNIEEWRIDFTRQKCKAFQITLNEIFDPSCGTMPGQGLSLSGLNLVVGGKKGYNPIRAKNTTGGNG